MTTLLNKDCEKRFLISIEYIFPIFQWFEVNCTVQEYGKIPIWEPCNYASNMAYYHTVTEICSRKEWSMPEESGKFFVDNNFVCEPHSTSLNLYCNAS